MRHTRHGMRAVVALAVVCGVLTGTLSTAQAAQAAKPKTYYVSLGDSYSVGYQPDRGSTPGYTVVVAKATAADARQFRLRWSHDHVAGLVSRVP